MGGGVHVEPYSCLLPLLFSAAIATVIASATATGIAIAIATAYRSWAEGPAGRAE